jgi:hypothetical protein
MRTVRSLFWATLPFIAACAGVEVHTDYDSAADFTRYKTYYWAKTPTTPQNPLMAERIVSEIDGQLYAKGWRKAAEGAADAAVAAHVTTREKEQIDTMYNSMGPGWYGRGMYGGMYGGLGGGATMATSTVNYYTIGTLFVDIFDAKTKKAIWHGTAEETVGSDSQDNAKKVSEAALQMFKNFPPPGAAGQPPR